MLTPATPPAHGGRLRAAAARWRIPLADWMDLSTGINPHGWAPPTPPDPALWARLPEDDDGLVAAAAGCYGVPPTALLPVAGSQAAILGLPRLRPPGRVGVLTPGYAEHAWGWQQAGHRVLPVAAGAIDDQLAGLDVLVLIHPNNPTGARFSRADLLRWHETLARRGGWLVVDEAFMDATPTASLADCVPLPGLVLLRSLGKFFGLAGARVGFVFAAPDLLRSLAMLLGPWTIATPARSLAAAALADRDWQAAARSGLEQAGARLAALLQAHGLPPGGGCALFQWVPHPAAAELHDRLARQAILTRLFDDPPALRLGLPGGESDWARLTAALEQITGG